MKKKIGVFLLALLCFLMSACTEKEGTPEMHVYYLNADGNALLQETCSLTTVEDALEKLNSRFALPKGLKLERWENQRGYLQLYWNDAYEKLSKTTEVLLRAAYVQTLTQVDSVNFVSFYVDGEALTDSSGNAIGMMRAEDFVQSTGSSMDSYQTTDLTLYFADKDGKTLSKSKKNGVRYNVNTAIERLVVEQLIKGTTSSDMQATVPKTTTILGVSVKEGICYVNLDSKFISDSYDLNPEVVIYSIVNSIIANGNVTKVQILLDGASDVVYKNKVDLSKPLEWNANLLEEK